VLFLLLVVPTAFSQQQKAPPPAVPGSVPKPISVVASETNERIAQLPPLPDRFAFVVFWIASIGSRVPPYMLLWMTTFTAIGLVIPQHSTLEYYFRRLFARDA